MFLGKNGGKTIRILEAREQGLQSVSFVVKFFIFATFNTFILHSNHAIPMYPLYIQRMLIDLELDFDSTGYEDKSVARYFAFVYRDGKTSIVFPSGTSHKIAIVEIPDQGYISQDTIKVDYVVLNEDEFKAGSAPHGLYRRVTWAEDTDYVWVSDSTLEFIYVVDLAQKKVVKTIKEMGASSMVSIQNFERSRQIEMQKQIVQDMAKKDDRSTEIAAIVIGCFALLAGIVNLVYMSKMRKEFQASISADEPVKLVHADLEETSAQGINSIN